MQHPLDIAVVGAGISGLAVAIMLRQSGHTVTLYERFPASKPIGSGLLLQPTGLAALDRLDLREAIESLGHPIERLHGLTDKGRTVFNLYYTDLAEAGRGLAIHRSALHQTLWDRFKNSGAALVTDCAIVGAGFDDAEKAHFIDEHGRRLPDADLLIDASGNTSTLRPAVNHQQAHPFQYGAVWTTVSDIGIQARTLAQRYIDARVMLGYLPLGQTQPEGPPLAALFWSLKPEQHAHWRDHFGDWQQQACTLWPELSPVINGLKGPEEFTLARYQHYTAKKLSRQNLVLIGDAAHATSPQLGQGANQGLIDAVVLSDALGQFTTIDSALKHYAIKRRNHVRFYQSASAVMTPLFQSDSRVLAKIRDITFNPLRSIPFIRHEMVRTLAGLKTGWLSSETADEIVNHSAARHSRKIS